MPEGYVETVLRLGTILSSADFWQKAAGDVEVRDDSHTTIKKVDIESICILYNIIYYNIESICIYSTYLLYTTSYITCIFRNLIHMIIHSYDVHAVHGLKYQHVSFRLIKTY